MQLLQLKARPVCMQHPRREEVSRTPAPCDNTANCEVKSTLMSFNVRPRKSRLTLATLPVLCALVSIAQLDGRKDADTAQTRACDDAGSGTVATVDVSHRPAVLELSLNCM